ncbi:ATP-binding protein [Pusillimonas caeni]|uniref:ATP-dependent nuclease n=1 Tax=Pusillimonas caeni TaxID=1348472 RepID=UPI000E59945A|nr:AAA family ATPase [Pusillimonas caeni]TFL09315.1 ATP-binding protein [Pusillimonas caeni]
MISSFQLKFGRSPDTPGETIAATPVTVFVGPNNSGKSRILREIEHFCRTGQKHANDSLLAELTFSGLTSERAAQSIERICQPPQPGEAQQLDHVFVGSKYGRNQVPIASLKQFVEAPTSNISAFCQWYLTHLTLMLDGSSRIGLVRQQGAGDLQHPPESSFQMLFRDDAKRHEVRRIVFDAFGRHFVLDPTNLGQLRIRLSDRAPRDDMEERGIHADAVQFHSSAQIIDEASDGVKAFTGIVTEVMAGDPSVVLVDEPEAFLHPSLASKLAQEVARAALSADKRIFASTHSPQFVMGCIQSGAPVNIIRLTYRGGVATARILPSDELLELMRHPLLRSTGLLSGLFYEFVIVTESDADRAFYQEVNERLLQFKPEWGIPNCLFINAQNKQTVQTLLRPLRKLGIPAAGIVDVDILKEGGVNWMNLLMSMDVPHLSRGGFATLRTAVKNAMDATGKDMKRQGGLAILSDTDRQAAEDLLNQLKQYGTFVIPGGELESWMKHLGATGHGPAWLIDIFERMGEDPSNPNYVRPSEDDVWVFIRDIRGWLVDPTRRGIPA